MDDLANLVTPDEVIVCEGNPAGSQGKNAEFDAAVYNEIFAEEYPDVKFVSGGASNDVIGDRFQFVAALPKIAAGIVVRRLVDRDEMSDEEIRELQSKGVRVLKRRHLEAYLYDDEVLAALCEHAGQPEVTSKLLEEKAQAIAALAERGRSSDDIKSAAPTIAIKAKILLKMMGAGKTPDAFAKANLVPLITPGMRIYEELKVEIFA